jgi:hypothetical protein
MRGLEGRINEQSIVAFKSGRKEQVSYPRQAPKEVYQQPREVNLYNRKKMTRVPRSGK